MNYRSSVEPDFEAPSSFNQRVKLFRESARLRNASVPDRNESSAADEGRADSDRGKASRANGGER